MPSGLPDSDAPADDRGELVLFVQALRAAVEWQSATGSTGLPRDPEAKKRIGLDAGAEGPRADGNDRRPSHEPGGAETPLAERAAAPAPQERAAQREPGPAGLSVLQPTPTVQPPLRVAAGASLEALAEQVAGCRTCGLCEHRTQTVFARGTGKSGLCFVGEGPGADEDAQGAPFVGAAGQLLDRMIAAMGIDRDDVYVANIVKCRPPDNRKPTAEEMAACVPYLHRQLELLQPSVIVALGATALEGLLGKTGGITRHRGRFHLYRGKIAVMPTFHPAYLLRQPSAKREVWSDLQEVLRHMGRPLKEPRP
jgi:uracil-DNA glycosylase family 4